MWFGSDSDGVCWVGAGGGLLLRSWFKCLSISCDASMCLGGIPLALLSFRQRAEVVSALTEEWLMIEVVSVVCSMAVVSWQLLFWGLGL